MRAFPVKLFVTTALSSPALARDDSWYVSLDGGESEEDEYLPVGRVPDLPDEIFGYDFGSFDGDYDFPGIKLTTANHPVVVVASTPMQQLRIDRLAHRYRDDSHRSRGFWS